MKKVLALVLALCLALSLAACGGSGSSSSTPAASGSGSEPAASTTPTAAGSVYYLNFKPEQDEAWQALAKAYTAETGVPVTVVTAASGEYETTLMAEMGKSEAPTLFQVNGPVGLANWKDYCYDLSGSDIYTQLTSRPVYALDKAIASTHDRKDRDAAHKAYISIPFYHRRYPGQKRRVLRLEGINHRIFARRCIRRFIAYEIQIRVSRIQFFHHPNKIPAGGANDLCPVQHSQINALIERVDRILRSIIIGVRMACFLAELLDTLIGALEKPPVIDAAAASGTDQGNFSAAGTGIGVFTGFSLLGNRLGLTSGLV